MKLRESRSAIGGGDSVSSAKEWVYRPGIEHLLLYFVFLLTFAHYFITYLLRSKFNGNLASPTRVWLPVLEKCQHVSTSCPSMFSLHNFCKLISNGAHLKKIVVNTDHVHVESKPE